MESLLSEDQSIVDQSTADTQLIIAYGTLKRLGWEPKYAGPYKLIALTPKKV